MTKRVPEIRFEGFTDDWEQRSLGDLASVRTGKAFSSLDFSEDGEYLVVTNKNIQDEKNGISSDGDRINISDKTTLSNYLLKGNNVLVTMDGVNIGKTGKYTDGKAVLAQRVGRINSDQIEFIYQVTSNYKFQLEMNKLSVGNAIKHISLKQISDYTFSTPINDEEKERIGILFNDLDKIITLHQRKLEQLQSMKNGFLQKMFPKDGEKEPKIRFPGFADDWEQRKLGDIYKKIRNAFVGTATPYYVEEGNFYLESNNIKDGNINRKTEVFINDEFYEKQKDKWLKTGDLVMVQSGHVGHTAVIPEELNNTAAHALIMFQEQKRKTNPYFLNYQFLTDRSKRKLDMITTGNTIKHILASEMKNFEVFVCENDEENLIADFFKKLDDTIALHQRELELLKQTKKAFLQKMFV